ncbi:MAG TPA: ABC transporter permease [Blastocatellia bacterium]|nr:ABC transporter permease [Blastocatellia bacterium]
MAKAGREVISTDAAPNETGRTDQPKSPSWSHPLVELTMARIREFVRRPEAIFWVFVFPVLMAFALGIAFRNTKPEKIRVAVDSETPNAPAVAAAISGSAQLQAIVLTPARAAQVLRTGKVALVIKGDPSPSTDAGLPASYQYRFDPTRPDSTVARSAVDDALQRAAGRRDLVQANDQTVSEPGARYIDFLIPGLIGLNLMGSAMWGIGFAIVNARLHKLIKRMAATPMKRWHYLLSYFLSRLLFLFLEVVAILAFAYLVFDVRVYGSLPGFILITLLGSMAFAGIGLLVAARTQTTEGVSGLMNLVMLPMWLLSGTFFSASRFPDFAQPLIKLLPLTVLNEILRSIMNDGTPLSANLPNLLLLIAWGVIPFAIAVRIFKWQ